MPSWCSLKLCLSYCLGMYRIIWEILSTEAMHFEKWLPPFISCVGAWSLFFSLEISMNATGNHTSHRLSWQRRNYLATAWLPSQELWQNMPDSSLQKLLRKWLCCFTELKRWGKRIMFLISLGKKLFQHLKSLDLKKIGPYDILMISEC